MVQIFWVCIKVYIFISNRYDILANHIMSVDITEIQKIHNDSERVCNQNIHRHNNAILVMVKKQRCSLRQYDRTEQSKHYDI